MENTSGQGKNTVVPQEIKGLAWGAFFLNFIWGIFNRTWIALLALIPLVNLVMVFVLLFKGREWAWRNKHWDSVEHFNKIQRRWAIAGLIVVLAPFIIFLILGFGLIVTFFGMMFGMQGAMDSAMKDAGKSKPEISAPATSTVKKLVPSTAAPAPAKNTVPAPTAPSVATPSATAATPDARLMTPEELKEFNAMFEKADKEGLVTHSKIDSKTGKTTSSSHGEPGTTSSAKNTKKDSEAKQQQPVKESAAQSPASPIAATDVHATPVQTHQPPSATIAATDPKALAKLKRDIGIEVKSSAKRPKRHEPTDLRHCLDLPSNEAIAKCAGE